MAQKFDVIWNSCSRYTLDKNSKETCTKRLNQKFKSFTVQGNSKSGVMLFCIRGRYFSSWLTSKCWWHTVSFQALRHNSVVTIYSDTRCFPHFFFYQAVRQNDFRHAIPVKWLQSKSLVVFPKCKHWLPLFQPRMASKMWCGNVNSSSLKISYLLLRSCLWFERLGGCSSILRQIAQMTSYSHELTLLLMTRC